MKRRIYLENTYPDRGIIKHLGGAIYDSQKKQWWIPSSIDKKPYKKWLPSDYIYKFRIYLNVPSSDDAEVQIAGALWDEREEGYWIDGHVEREAFRKWLPRKYHPDHKPPYLAINMIPNASHGLNLHKAFLPKSQWDKLRHTVYRNAGNRCEICGSKGSRSIECNEHWVFEGLDSDDKCKIQRLERLEALCFECHTCVHMGRTIRAGDSPRAINHLREINDWDAVTCEEHDREARREWESRDRYKWDFDLSLIKAYGIHSVVIDLKNTKALETRIHGVDIKYLSTARLPHIPSINAVRSESESQNKAKPYHHKSKHCEGIIQRFWLPLSLLMGILLAAKPLGLASWILDNISMGTRYIYQYIKQLRQFTRS